MDIIMSPGTFIEQFHDVKENKERSIAFIKLWKGRCSINIETYTGNENIDTQRNFTHEMAMTLALLKQKHLLTDEEIK